MWPFRPERLSDIFSDEEIQSLIVLGDGVGSAVSLIETLPDGSFRSIDAEPRREELRPDPFCTFFRHGVSGGGPAFAGADRACAECEQRLARFALAPASSSMPGERGAPAEGSVARRRCHMGLTDYFVPLEVGGKKVAGLVAGRKVESDDDRLRIRKIVGKLGKLTRAETANLAEGKEGLLIEPADEKARERLIHEIAAIPAGSGALVEHLLAMARRLGNLAAGQFEGRRLRREEEILSRVDAWSPEPPRSFGDLGRHASGLLDILRAETRLDFLALFARTPRELDEAGCKPSLVAESGLGVGAKKRFIEVDWPRLPANPGGARGPITRGRDAASATVSALHATAEAPAGLKDRLTKSIFFMPVEAGPGLEAALAFGAAASAAAPNDPDYLFLARLAAAVARRYYALAALLERGRLRERLQRLEEALAEAKTARKTAVETKGFSDFDGRRLVDACLERVKEKAAWRGVEIDARSLPERLPLRGNRDALGGALENLFAEGIERTCSGSSAKKPAPLRVFLKRGRRSAVFGVEFVGEFLEPARRRELFRRPLRAPEPSGAPASNVALADALATARRHRGRLRLESERLHRFDDDPGRWLGRSAFLLELPSADPRTPPAAGTGTPA